MKRIIKTGKNVLIVFFLSTVVKVLGISKNFIKIPLLHPVTWLPVATVIAISRKHRSYATTA
jgi:uncharacterized membrane protein